MEDENLTPTKLAMRCVDDEKCLDDQNSISSQPSLEQGTNVNETPCHSYSYRQIKMEEMEFKLEDLHHSIDIKDEPSNVEIQPEIGFACKVCDYKGTHKGTFERHLRTHTGEKRFVCLIYDKKFLRKEHLKGHMKTHTREKSFECDICDYKCAWKGILKKHLVTHTGEKIKIK